MPNPRGAPENLRPFRTGQSGNPGGRPKGLSLTRLVREELQRPADDGSGRTKAEMVAEKIVSLAQAGDRAMIPLVWRYVDGEPRQAIDAAVEDLAEQIAAQMGLDAKELLEAFKRDVGTA